MAIAVDVVVCIHIFVVQQADSALFEQVFIHINRFIQLDGHIKRLNLQLHAAGFDARKVQQLLDHAGQTARLLLDDRQALHDLLRVLAAAGQQCLTPTADSGQRCTQFV